MARRGQTLRPLPGPYTCSLSLSLNPILDHLVSAVRQILNSFGFCSGRWRVQLDKLGRSASSPLPCCSSTSLWHHWGRLVVFVFFLMPEIIMFVLKGWSCWSCSSPFFHWFSSTVVWFIYALPILIRDVPMTFALSSWQSYSMHVPKEDEEIRTQYEDISFKEKRRSITCSNQFLIRKSRWNLMPSQNLWRTSLLHS